MYFIISDKASFAIESVPSCLTKVSIFDVVTSTMLSFSINSRMKGTELESWVMRNSSLEARKSEVASELEDNIFKAKLPPSTSMKFCLPSDCKRRALAIVLVTSSETSLVFISNSREAFVDMSLAESGKRPSVFRTSKARGRSLAECNRPFSFSFRSSKICSTSPNRSPEEIRATLALMIALSTD